MKDYDPMDRFGPESAADYDDTSLRGDEAHTVDLLAQLAGDGPVLERSGAGPPSSARPRIRRRTMPNS